MDLQDVLNILLHLSDAGMNGKALSVLSDPNAESEKFTVVIYNLNDDQFNQEHVVNGMNMQEEALCQTLRLLLGNGYNADITISLTRVAKLK